MKAGRWGTLLLVALLAGLFAYLNAGHRVTLSLGFITLYRISLVRLVLGSFVLGMITMFLVGLRHDLAMRRALRERDRPPPDDGPTAPPPYDATDRWTAPASTHRALDPE